MFQFGQREFLLPVVACFGLLCALGAFAYPAYPECHFTGFLLSVHEAARHLRSEHSRVQLQCASSECESELSGACPPACRSCALVLAPCRDPARLSECFDRISSVMRGYDDSLQAFRQTLSPPVAGESPLSLCKPNEVGTLNSTINRVQNALAALKSGDALQPASNPAQNITFIDPGITEPSCWDEKVGTHLFLRKFEWCTRRAYRAAISGPCRPMLV